MYLVINSASRLYEVDMAECRDSPNPRKPCRKGSDTAVYIWIAGELQIVAIAVKVECLAVRRYSNGGIPAERPRPAGYQVNRPDSGVEKKLCAAA
jgi:hypothetical protein